MDKKISLVLLLIIFLGFTVRFYKISSIPPSLYGDEIAFSWNAYSILKTGSDEYGIRYPLQFKSFGDYKSPLPVYLLVPFIWAFGLNVLTVRTVVVLFSTLSIIFVYFLTREAQKVFLGGRIYVKLSLLTAFLLAISSWHIHLSRGYFEATIALFFTIAAAFYLLKGIKHLRYGYLSVFFFVLSCYTYFTPRITAPLMLVSFLLYLRLIFKNYSFKNILLLIVSFFLLIAPLIFLSVSKEGSSRFTYLWGSRVNQAFENAALEQTNESKSFLLRKLIHNKWLVLAREIKNDYFEHFSPNFWYLYGDNSLRYFLGKNGFFYLAELPFLLIGIYYVFKKYAPLGWFFLLWLAISPIPAALVGRSFGVRSLAMLPAPFIFVSFGIVHGFNLLKTKINRQLIAIPLTILLISGFTIYSLRYFNDYKNYGASWWGYENKVALDYAKNKEVNYNQIFISNYYTGAELAYAFYRVIDPEEFRNLRFTNFVEIKGRKFLNIGKYYFGTFDLSPENINSFTLPPQSLYLAGPLEVTTSDTLNDPADDRILYSVYSFD